MANSDGTVKIETSVDDSGLKTGLKDVESTVKSKIKGISDSTKGLRSDWKSALDDIGGYAKKGFSALGSAAVTAAKAGATAVAGVSTAMAGLAVAGVKYNASIESYQTSFEVMTGSAEKAEEVITRLKKVGAETPFELPQLADTTQLLMNYGFTADEAMNKMMMLGDISQGSADKMSRIATAYGQMSSAGKVQLEDIKQMIEAGFNPLQEISETTGESMDSLYQRISDGALSVDEITESMKRATSEGGKYYQSMEKQSQTISGLISTLKDNAQQLLGNVMEPITESIRTDVLPAAVEAISTLSEAFEKDGVEGLIQAGQSVVTNILQGITTSLPNVMLTAGQIVSALANGVIAALPSIGQATLQILTTLLTGLMNSAESISATGMQLLADLCNGISAALPQLVPLAVSAILNFAMGIVQNLPQVIDAGLNMLVSLATGIANALPELIAKVPLIINEFCANIDSLLPKILETGIKILIELGKGIINAIPTIIANAGEIMKAIINVILHVDMLALGKNIISKLADGVKNAGGSVWSAVKQILKDAVNAIKNTNWIELGKDIIRGIASGVKSMARFLIDSAVSVVSGAFDTVKGWLGIHSPSRKAKKEIGYNWIKGEAEGLEEKAPELQKSATSTTKKAFDATKKEMASRFVAEAQSKSYQHPAAAYIESENDISDDNQDDSPIVIQNQFIVDSDVLVDKTAKATVKKISNDQKGKGRYKS